MAISSVVSNYELLVKPLVQPDADILGAGRTIIQGYFLTITNLNTSVAARLRLNFRAQSVDLNSQPLLAFLDANGTNSLLVPTLSGATSRTYTFTIEPGDTGLFILQPDVTQKSVVENANVEVRGYATLSLATPFGSNSFNLLVTPQQRGTFLPKGYTVPPVPPASAARTREDFDQLAYGLPTATGGSQITLAQINFPIGRPPILSPELLELDPDLLRQIQENPALLTRPGVDPVRMAPAIPADSLQQALNLMTERIEGLEVLMSQQVGQPVVTNGTVAVK
ncbi:MAG: hypothetical protein B0A82_25050 [Alkalinema sp. CACIAM 70d]|nr:MAG: hypothetical protein B0A82_25050 [Alkalinema sp. CACIAM 70d]